MSSLSATYLEKIRFVQLTRDQESYVVWLLHEKDGHLVAEQLSASPTDDGGGVCRLDVLSLVFPCCSAAPVNVDGEQVFQQVCLKSRSISPPENPAPSVCCPNERSPFFSPSPPQSTQSTCYALAQPYPHSSPVIEPLSRSPGQELSYESASVPIPPPNAQRKRTSLNTSCQRAPAKKQKVTTPQAASRLWKQLRSPAKQGSYERSTLSNDADIIKKLGDFKELVRSNPGEVDKFVGQLQAWLRQVQQQSSLHLAALQHLLACVDLYNWVNRSDKNLERKGDKERWSEVQIARYRNMLANELCKTKDGKSDRLGLVILAAITAKGVKFGHLQNAAGDEKIEIVQQFAALARPILEKGLKTLEVTEAPNPVSFVCWFLEKPVEELANICEALCFTELSVGHCYPSPAIWHEIRAPSSLEVFENCESHSNGNAEGFFWLLQAADQSEETAQDSIYEEPVTNRAQLDNMAWNLSDLLDPDAGHLGFN